MLQLAAQNQEATVRIVSLKPGSYSLGRTPENQIAIPVPSVSSQHCLLTANEHGVSIRDLGSTNGTFVNNQPVQEHAAYPGDVIRFGNESYVLEKSQPMHVASASSSTAGGKLGLSLPSKPPERPAVSESVVHPSVIKRLEAQAALKPEVGSFWAELGLAFAYPFRGSGWLKLIIGTIIFVLLDFGAKFSFWITILGIGYLFAYIQSHITHSADGQRDSADWPDVSSWWEDIVRPCLLYTLVGVCSFAPLLAYLFFGAGDEPNPIIIFGLGALGLLYYPMAILATAMSDSFNGLNPLCVFPPIARLPLEYLATCGLFFLLVGIGGLFNVLMSLVTIPFVTVLPAGFVGLYLLTVSARTLGILYCTKKEKFGWFD